MRQLLLPTLIVTVAGISGCSSYTYEKPTATLPPAEQVTPAGAQLVENDLVQYGRSWLFFHRPKGQGRLVITGDAIHWENRDQPARSFSIRPDLVSSLTLRCAARAAQNACLELVIRTVADRKYYFRDADWAAGGNRQIMEVYDYMKGHYPSMSFRHKMAESMD